MSSGRTVLVRLLGAVAMAAISLVLSLALKDAFGAPNYGLGVVIGVTVTCYLFGLPAAALCLILSLGIGGLLLEYLEPRSIYGRDHIEEVARIITIVATCAVTCALVVALQNAGRRLSATNRLLEDAQCRLSAALDCERRIAGTVQTAFLPRIPEQMGNIALAAKYIPGSDEARIGGDFYDVTELADGRISISIGDVSGKGIDAARQAVISRYGLRGFLPASSSPAECLSELNDLLCGDPDFGGFVTVFLGILEPVSGVLKYCTGGHTLPLVLRQSEEQPFELRPNGHLLGALPDVSHLDDEVALGPGDLMLLPTDGLTEAKVADGMLGPEGLGNVLAMTAKESSGNIDELLDRIVERVRELAGGYLSDDATAVLVRIEDR